MKKEIFVTYRHESQEHSDKVIAFVNYLRERNYHAEMDALLSQEEASIDFTRMMHQGITDYDKIIIVLSKGYKERADTFTGGVGTEYSLIIKEINENLQKYILVSFDGINNDITPLSFKGREIIDLSNSENYNKLHAKLQGKNTVRFSEVGGDKPLVHARVVPPIKVLDEKQELEILDIDSNYEKGMLQARLINNAQYNLIVKIQNSGKATISDYDVEVEIPRLLTEWNSSGRIENGITIYTFEGIKLYPNQTRIVGEIKLLLRYNEVDLAENSSLLVRVLSDKGEQERRFPIFSIAYSPEDRQKRALTRNDFRGVRGPFY